MRRMTLARLIRRWLLLGATLPETTMSEATNGVTMDAVSAYPPLDKLAMNAAYGKVPQATIKLSDLAGWQLYHGMGPSPARSPATSGPRF